MGWQVREGRRGACDRLHKAVCAHKHTPCSRGTKKLKMGIGIRAEALANDIMGIDQIMASKHCRTINFWFSVGAWEPEKESIL